MTIRKNTRSALISCALAMLLCCSMLIGTTFAWFTDSVTSDGNVIKTGTLKVGMYWVEGDKDPNAEATVWTDASSGAIFNNDLWEPGHTEVRHIKIENKGSLALKYKLNIVANDEFSELTDVIDVYYIDPATAAITDRTQLTEDYKIGTLTEVLAGLDNSGNGVLVPAGKEGDGFKSVETVTIALKMQESAENRYQDLSVGTEFSIMLFATQYTYENDSFNDQYDADAKYDINNVYIGNVKYDTIADAIDAANDGDTIRLTAGTFHEALDLQGKSLTIQGAGKAATIIAGPEDYTTDNIPMQSWAGWGQDANVYALISANKDVTIKDLTVSADPEQIGEVAEFRHEGAYAFVGIHVQSANATIENVNIKNIKPDTVTGNDHHNFGLYITSAINDTNTYTATYKNGTVSGVNRGGIYCWSNQYTLNFENVTVVGPGNITDPNGTLTPAAGSESNNAIYAFCSFYVCSPATYENVVIRDSWCVAWWGGASWAWTDPAWSTNPPTGVTCIDCGTAN